MSDRHPTTATFNSTVIETGLSATLDASAVACTVVARPEQLPELASALGEAERVAVDTEVPIGGPGAGCLRVMSVAMRDATGFERAFVVDCRDVDPVLLQPVLTGIEADAWNANFDARVIDAAVWNRTRPSEPAANPVTDHIRWWDGLLADALLFQGRSGFTWFHGLAWATRHYLGIEADGKGTTQLSFTEDDNLTEAQIAYAAADAVHTLWVCDRIRGRLAEAGLESVCAVEMAARPFLDQMERTGLPFDWDGWRTELDTIENQRRDVVSRLAILTGGGQGSLFDASVEPTWNPASDHQVRVALNRWADDRVAAWTAERFGRSRPLSDHDSVTATVLAEIGGELCQGLLEFRNLSKILTTYGESIHDHLAADGRIRPHYLQVVGTNTGRLASRFPNAQNFSPRMKPHFRPSVPDRVFVHADLSQAELRYLAQVAEDKPLRAAFARGDDVHVSTAASMYGFDPDRVRLDDPDRFKRLRQQAKALNFGIAYGSGAAALARSLSNEGTPTSVPEAEELLARYRRTYPGTTAWAEARIAEIEAIRDTTVDIDWAQSMRLARGFRAVADIRRRFRSDEDRWPDPTEIADAHPDRLEVEPGVLEDEIAWLLRYPAPVALLADGTPFTFAGRTLLGRRQQFNLHLDRLFLTAVMAAVQAEAPDLIRIRDRFAKEHGLRLQPGGLADNDRSLARQFDDRPLRRRYIEVVADELGRSVAFGFLHRAARERVSAMVNAWRNAPIQGGVADIMLVAYADLHRRLRRFDGAEPIQTVHDSIVIECRAGDAPAVAVEIKAALEQAFNSICPDVVAKADVDIRTSLAEGDVVEIPAAVRADADDDLARGTR